MQNLPLRQKPKSPSWKLVDSVNHLEAEKLRCTASKNYERAKILKMAMEEEVRVDVGLKWTLTHKVKTRKQEEELKAQEHERQEQERKSFDEAFDRIFEQFTSEWDRNLALVEGECERQLESLAQRHERELVELEKELREKQAKLRPRFSVLYTEMRRQEKELGKLEVYEEAATLRDKLKVQEQKELKRVQDSKEAYVQGRLAYLRKRQDEEMRFHQTRCKNVISKTKHQRKEEEARLRRKRKNIEQDMRHAHTMEFITYREVQKTIENSRKTSKALSSTFAGTKLLERSKKYELPSLCELYGDQV